MHHSTKRLVGVGVRNNCTFMVNIIVHLHQKLLLLFVHLIHSRGRLFPSHVGQSCNRGITSHTSPNPIKLSVVMRGSSSKLIFISQHWFRQASIVICFFNSRTKQMSFQKLYGGLEDLKKTTNFITAAGLVV